MMDNIYNFTKLRFIELPEILCSNCIHQKECCANEEMDDCETYMIADNGMDEVEPA